MATASSSEAVKSIADRLRQFSCSGPDFTTAPSALPTPVAQPAVLPSHAAASSSFPWMTVIAVAVGIGVTLLVVKLWMSWRDGGAAPAPPPAAAPVNPLQSQEFFQALAKEMVATKRANAVPFVSAPVSAPTPTAAPSAAAASATAAAAPMAEEMPAEDPQLMSDPNFTPLD